MYTAILALPLIGFLVAGGLRRQIGPNVAMAVTTGGVCLAALLSWGAFVSVALGHQTVDTIELFRWIDVGDFQASWSIRVDTMTAAMLIVVTSVSALVHIYSIGYMEHDPDKARFFAYLSLFTFAMLMLVTADNLLQLFFGWEGVGLASYLLIGFWYKKPSANAAAIKAFVVNRVGDFGFALGIFAAFVTFGSIEFDVILGAIKTSTPVTPFYASEAVVPQDAVMSFLGYSVPALELIGFLLFIGAMGKSAQFFLHVWLPDAMEGPTPVSALIHAATMVTAGVFLVCRMWPVYEFAPFAAGFIAIIGAVTALFAATVGVAQNDIKRVVAYSTCSQLGYMFFAAGVGAYGAAMFHLFTHAFFKALLFLGAGAVIHGLHDEQDMRKMGGVAGKMRWTWLMMIIGTLALTGVGIPGTPFGFAGFFSKDRVIEDAFLVGSQVGQFAFWMGIIAAGLTSFYSWRLIFMTFHGTHRGPKPVYDHAHEAPWIMRGPLVALSLGAVLAGVVFYPHFVGKKSDEFWGDALPTRVALFESYEVVAAAHGGDGHGEASHGAHADDEAGHGDDASHTDAGHAGDGHGVKDAEAHGSDDGHHGYHGEGYAKYHAPHPPVWVLWLPVGVTAFGFVLAVFFYLWNQGLGASIAARGGPLHGLLSNKWYFDEIYNATFVKLTRGVGDFFWKVVDKRIIDRFGPDGFAAAAQWFARRYSKIQSGYLYHYAFLMLIGVVVLTTLLIAQRG